MSKPITVYSTLRGPNPRKVTMVLEELKVPYEIKNVENSEMKKEPFESININGRVPAIFDPNTNVTLWESGAILEYIIATYDKSHELSYGDKSPEKFLCIQWLHFQMSGQGPYFGQLAWFKRYHPEQVPSAVDRYTKEVHRVLSVLDRHLAKNGTGWLVGNKCTYADIAFVPWNSAFELLLGPEASKELEVQYPHFSKWYNATIARPGVAKALKDAMADRQKAS